MDSSFRFKQFSVSNVRSALKVGTDAVLLGAAVTLLPEDQYALDLGTGTGVIALMVAQRSPQLQITGIDIDEASALEAAENFANSPWAERLTALHQDALSFHPKHSFDLIVSNPPYFESSLKNPNQREATARHNDSLSLNSICRIACEQLSEQGRISLILPADSLVKLRRTAASWGLYPFRILMIHTTEKKPAKRIIVELSRRKVTPNEEKLVLLSSGEKTAEYIALTQEFYL